MEKMSKMRVSENARERERARARAREIEIEKCVREMV
jgi:hypothetical protein